MLFRSVVKDPFQYKNILEHELVHVEQWKKWGIILWITYLFLPVPFGFAWFRWRWEREAYLVQIRSSSNCEKKINQIVNSLWYGYGWTWPKSWMRQWFLNKIKSF